MTRATSGRRWSWAAAVVGLLVLAALWFHWIGLGYPFRGEEVYIRSAREHLEAHEFADDPFWSLDDRPRVLVGYEGFRVHVTFGFDGLVSGGEVGVLMKRDGTVIQETLSP